MLPGLSVKGQKNLLIDGNRFLLTGMIKGFPSYISTIKSNLQKPLTTINGVESKPKEALLALGMEKYSIIQASINDASQKKFKRIDTLASYVFISLVSFNKFFLLFPHASFHQLSLNNHNTFIIRFLFSKLFSRIGQWGNSNTRHSNWTN